MASRNYFTAPSLWQSIADFYTHLPEEHHPGASVPPLLRTVLFYAGIILLLVLVACSIIVTRKIELHLTELSEL